MDQTICLDWASAVYRFLAGFGLVLSPVIIQMACAWLPIFGIGVFLVRLFEKAIAPEMIRALISLAAVAALVLAALWTDGACVPYRP